MADSKMLPECSEGFLNDTNNEDDAIVIETSAESPDGDDIDKEWAWVVLFATWMTLVMLGAVVTSVGIFYMYMIEAFDESTTSLAWVGSLFSSLCFFLGPAASAISNRYSRRHCIMIGGLLLSAALVGSSLATAVWMMLLFFGVLAGSAIGLILTTCTIGPGFYFRKKQSFAAAVSQTGYTFGTIIGPIILTSLEEQYGWRGALFIVAGLMLNICVFGAVSRPSSLENKRIVCVNPETDRWQGRSTVKLSLLQKHCRCPDKDSLIRNSGFWFLVTAITLSNFSMSIVYLHLPRYADIQGASPLQINMLFLMLGSSGIASKLLVGVGTGNDTSNKMLDKKCLLFAAYSILAISLTVLPHMSCSQTGRLVCSALIGFYYNVEPAMYVTITNELLGLRKLSIAVGIEIFGVGIGYLVGPPTAAAIEDWTGDYKYPFYMAGGMYFLAACFCLWMMNAIGVTTDSYTVDVADQLDISRFHEKTPLAIKLDEHSGTATGQTSNVSNRTET